MKPATALNPTKPPGLKKRTASQEAKMNQHLSEFTVAKGLPSRHLAVHKAVSANQFEAHIPEYQHRISEVFFGERPKPTNLVAEPIVLKFVIPVIANPTAPSKASRISLPLVADASALIPRSLTGHIHRKSGAPFAIASKSVQSSMHNLPVSVPVPTMSIVPSVPTSHLVSPLTQTMSHVNSPPALPLTATYSNSTSTLQVSTSGLTMMKQSVHLEPCTQSLVRHTLIPFSSDNAV